MMQDYYRLLEVHPDASADVITKAYRTLVRQCHPDTYHVSDKSLLEARMKDLNRAYETLQDPKLRAEYDARYHAWKQQEAETATKRLWMDRAKEIGYWFLLTVFLLITGRVLLRALVMLPLIPKLLVILAFAWMLRKLLLAIRKRRK